MGSGPASGRVASTRTNPSRPSAVRRNSGKPSPVDARAVVVGGAILFALAACGGDDGYAGVHTPATDRFDREGEVACPDDAIEVGAAGSTLWQSVDVEWRSNDLDGTLNEYLYFRLPDDILSLAVSVEQGDRWTAVNHAVLDDQVLLDLRTDLGEAPFFHEPVEVATLGMPINAATYPTGGCLAIDPVAYDTDGGERGTIHIVSRRDDGGPAYLDVNVVIVGDTDITDDEVAAALNRADAVYAATDELGIGEITSTRIDWPDPYVDAEGDETNRLRAASVGEDPFAVNLFFVQDFNEVGTLGIAAGIPGPNGVAETAASGVIISVDTHLDGDGIVLLTDMMGETIAHEVGHQLGLFHTSEAEGDYHDPIADTPECTAAQDSDGDGELLAEECDLVGGRNFMFWTASESFPQDGVSPTQAAVLRDNVIARPQ